LEPASEDREHKDLATWGVAALACGAIAVLSANLAALLPADMLAGLHGGRGDAGALLRLERQMDDLRLENQRLRQAQAELDSRFSLALDAQEGVARRVGALEVSLPAVFDAQAAGENIDYSVTTAGIAAPEEPNTVDVEGGSVSVTRVPMPLSMKSQREQSARPSLAVETPAPPAADAKAFGLALGQAVEPRYALEAWKDLSVKLGPLLLGLGPLVAAEAEGEKQRVVAGPLKNLAEATDLCQRLERLSVPCLPVPFTGQPLLGAE